MMVKRLPVIAIDGPAGSGKSSVARKVAQKTGLHYINSGAMYRAVALTAIREGIVPGDVNRIVQIASSLEMSFSLDRIGSIRTYIADEDITDKISGSQVAEMASIIAMYPELREQLVKSQQQMGEEGGVIMEGRDIQTVVFPKAEIKIFLTASVEERAMRRWKEHSDKGEYITYKEVLNDVTERDKRDEEREASPLKASDDAILLKSDGKTLEQVVDLIVKVYEIHRKRPDIKGKALGKAAGIV
ncbi:MAG: (d)CMP kinase [bacterium]